jgi:hypothetical protein
MVGHPRHGRPEGRTMCKFGCRQSLHPINTGIKSSGILGKPAKGIIFSAQVIDWPNRGQ